MKSLGEMLSLIGLVGTGLALLFLFKGEPDLWDQLHERAMRQAACSVAVEGQGNELPIAAERH